MTLEEARQILDLGAKASRKEIKGAYHRAARQWHPDRAPGGEEAKYRASMQEINIAYQRILKFLENYRYHLVDDEAPEDLHQWWASRFYTGVWGPPPPKEPKGEGD